MLVIAFISFHGLTPRQCLLPIADIAGLWSITVACNGFTDCYCLTILIASSTCSNYIVHGQAKVRKQVWSMSMSSQISPMTDMPMYICLCNT